MESRSVGWIKDYGHWKALKYKHCRWKVLNSASKGIFITKLIQLIFRWMEGLYKKTNILPDISSVRRFMTWPEVDVTKQY